MALKQVKSDGSSKLIAGATNTNSAAETSYNNTTSGLESTNVQGAIDELNGNKADNSIIEIGTITNTQIIGNVTQGEYLFTKAGLATVTLDATAQAWAYAELRFNGAVIDVVRSMETVNQFIHHYIIRCNKGDSITWSNANNGKTTISVAY